MSDAPPPILPPKRVPKSVKAKAAIKLLIPFYILGVLSFGFGYYTSYWIPAYFGGAMIVIATVMFVVMIILPWPNEVVRKPRKEDI